MKKTTVFILGIFLLTIIFLAVSCSMFERNASPPARSYTFDNNVDGTLLWSISNFYIHTDRFMPALAATSDRLVLVGMNGPSRSKQMLAVDSASGETIWKKTVQSLPKIAIRDSLVYQGDYDLLQAYDSLHGNIVWKTDLLRAGNILFIYPTDSAVLLYTSSGKSFTIDQTGRVTNKTDANFVHTALSDHGAYVITGEAIEALDHHTGKTIWKTPLENIINQQPVFYEDMIYVRTGLARVIGKIFALKEGDGQIAWSTDDQAVSNIGLLDPYLFYLSETGGLNFLDRETGEPVFSLPFSPQPFTVYSPDYPIGGFFVGSDPKNRIVFASLGDSYQVFAIKLLR